MPDIDEVVEFLAPAKLRQNLERATSIASDVDDFLERFDRFLGEAMRSLEE